MEAIGLQLPGGHDAVNERGDRGAISRSPSRFPSRSPAGGWRHDLGRWPVGEHQVHGDRATGRHQPAPVHADLRAAAGRVHSGPLAAAEETVERVLGKPRVAGVAGAIDSRPIRLVVGRQHRGRVGGGDEPASSEPAAVGHPRVEQHAVVVCLQAERAGGSGDGTDHRLRQRLRPPGPRVAKPERRQHLQRGRVRPAVCGRDPDGDLLGRRLGVFDQDVKPAVFGKHARVEEFVLRPLPLPQPIFGHQLIVGKGTLRVAVPQAHQRVRGGVVNVEVVFLDVFAMVALERGKAEEPFLEVGIFFIPKGRCEAEQLIPVTDPRDAILAPAVGLGTGHSIGEIPPGIAICGIILPDRAPCPVGEIGPPPPPAMGIVRDRTQPVGLGTGERWHRAVARNNRCRGNEVCCKESPGQTGHTSPWNPEAAPRPATA